MKFTFAALLSILILLAVFIAPIIVAIMDSGSRTPAIRFDTTHVDLGIVSIGDRGFATFLVHNTGQKTVRIQHPRSPCNCEFCDWSDLTIPPYSSHTFTVKWWVRPPVKSSPFVRVISFDSDEADLPTYTFPVVATIPSLASVDPSRPMATRTPSPKRYRPRFLSWLPF